MKSVVVHYQEIALKGRNRPWFIARLVRNLRAVTADLDIVDVRALMGRIEVILGPHADWDVVRRRIERVFGIANFARAGRTSRDLDEIAAAILADLPDEPVASFRVSVRRADKQFPLPSPQIEREVGGRIKQARGWRVNLTHPALNIRIEILPSESFYSFGREPGAGGLPTSASGPVACLLSGGIDSPVAAYRMMRRGCRVHLIHFHSYPIVSRTSQEKVREISALLTSYQLRTRLYLVPFGDVQRRIVVSVPPSARVVLYRRLMIRIAERLARRLGARALVTGEAVGQVASQTLENVATIDAVATMPILRPLIGMDKDEIVGEAQRLGTYTTSIIPDEDCCQLFTPKHPATRMSRFEAENAERDLPLDELIDQAVAATELQNLRFPAVEARASTPRDLGVPPAK